jgi:hypothetical protein
MGALIVVVMASSPMSCGEDLVAQALAARGAAAGFSTDEQAALRQCSAVESAKGERPVALVEALSDGVKALFLSCLGERGIALNTQKRMLGLLEENCRERTDREKVYVACYVERRRAQPKAGATSRAFPAVDVHSPRALGFGGLAKPDAGVRTR